MTDGPDQTPSPHHTLDHLRMLVEHAPDGIFLADARGRYVDMNPAACAMLGYSREELLGMSFRDILPDEDLEEAVRMFEGLRTGAPTWTQRRLRRKDGTHVLTEIRAWATPDGYRHAIVRDISERERAMQELRRSKELLQTVVSNAPVVLAAADRDGIFTLSEGKGLEAVGLKPGQAVGWSIWDLYADNPDNLDAARRVLYGESFVATVRVGDVVFESHYAPIVDGNGEVQGAIAVGVDVTERTRALEALRESQQRLRTVLDSAPILLGAVDREGIVTLMEGRLLSAFGLSPGALVGASVWDVYRNEPKMLDALRRALAGEPSTAAARIRGVDFEAHLAPARDDQGEIVGAIGVLLDVTERRRAETQLRHAQKMEMVGRLAGGVAHDVNNLMTAILLNTDAALRGLGEDHPVASDLRETHAIAHRAANMAHQLLAFSRREVVEPRVLDLNELIARAERMLRRLMGEDVELVTRLAPDLSAVRVDPTQFEQVLINLAVNARDAMPRGGRLTVQTADVALDADAAGRVPDLSAGAYVRLSVSDTGEGMSEDVRSHVFEPFYTTKPTGAGTGLGLAACYGIVRQAGGSITVESEPGRGTTFAIYLPRAEGPAAPLATASGAAPPGLPRGSETILLVEDEDAVRRLATRMLTGLGYTVIGAADGAEALRAAAEAGGIDLLLTDVVMPGMGGKELADRLRAERGEMKVLFTSGYTDDAILRHGVDERETPSVRKPFSPGVLARKVREVLDAPP